MFVDDELNDYSGGPITDNEVYLLDGDDTAIVLGTVFTTIEAGQGEDTVTYQGSGTCEISGGWGSDTLIGGASTDILNGDSGDDVLFGGAARDWLWGGFNFDDLHGGSGDDFLYGGAGFDNLWGDEDNDDLYGGSGNDTLRGGSGIDRMSGDDGDDTYEVTEGADRVLEHAGDGIDTVFADVSYTLPVNLEHLRLFGTDPINGTGNTLANQISGTAAANTLNGMGANDTLDGEAGNDRLIGGAGRDILIGDLNADDFIFMSVADSRGSLRDTIVDFNRAQGDDIWLSAIDANTKVAGNQAFTFRGASAFTGVAGQLRFQKIGTDTHIFGDTNGDKVADIIIISDVVVNFIAADFVL